MFTGMERRGHGNWTLELDGQIHVWPIHVGGLSEAALAEFAVLLGEDEVARGGRFRFSHLRQHFIAAHGTVRILLSRYTDLAPQSIRLLTGPSGKPFLAFRTEVRFNLSHSGCMVLLAVSTCEVGVDIEEVRSCGDLLPLAQRFFCTEEATEVMSLPRHERELGFFACWTRKEAYVKATGRGLSIPLDSFRVSVRPEEAARIVHISQDPLLAASWRIHDLRCLPGFVGAVAYQEPQRRVVVMKQIEAFDLLASM